MKKRIKSIVIVFLLFSQTMAQNSGLTLNKINAIYKAEYMASFQPDSTDVESKQTGIMFTLYMSEGYSYFVNHERYLLDSLLHEVAQGNIDQTFALTNVNAMPQPRANFRILKTIEEQKIVTISPIYNKEHAYKEPLSIINWQIKPKTKTIGNLHCQMATGSFSGRDYVAWFTTEIRIPEGPYKFYGLPGLIVRIADTRNHYSFELVEIKRTQETVRVLPSDPIQWTTKQRFNQEFDRFAADPVHFYEAEGMVFDRETRRRIRANMNERRRRNNNRIELQQY